MVVAKKSLGQHFLTDESFLDRIVNALPPLNPLKLIEIGVGLGDLTLKLLDRYPLKTYEIDSDLCEKMRARLKAEKKPFQLELVEKDALFLKEEEPYFLISNLPYYIATRLVLNALKDPKCRGLLVMTQKEVALKFCAKDSQNALSVLAHTIGNITLLFDVPPSAFSPPPKVFSSVFEVIKEPLKEKALASLAPAPFFEEALQKGFETLEDFLKACFSSPRKTLSNNLKKSVSYREKLDKVLDFLALENQPTSVRASEIKDYLKLLEYLLKG
ncbi:16S rRNA (adenine(1518)-N(6)/adenine(1519)-N(6))-dimethyltransferase RsmA [Helicobacter pylori]|uniref:16S rRNA (adenine(1518)-N(6)/adenine(1519)-N(6))- dimethyltransferase RsmA n=1 Tax=Helicobacter pylori TaxID=210 RepID=UPI0002BB33BF|nr:16S rRNA (adenine(1518)-N(6)/adenine(1519)-N(6))-dimethyltransferase RsmA [Helicobacter pylori]EMH23213.1 dimethyladenosine transferase [Helicobacter pylori GAM263BFi]WQV65917.1 16S rRNA (adenine(1518)-N(6)/adenine(1519)-N(6))-dimethyltransferase RsmA [Helicobacter pylori]